MNATLLLTLSPVVMILLKWTALLALGWTVHWLLRHRHARWRLIVWRSLLCFGLVIPLVYLFPIHLLRIPVEDAPDFLADFPDVAAPVTSGNSIRPTQSTAGSSAKSAEANATLPSVSSPRSKASSRLGSWNAVLVMIWALGCVWGAVRLVGLHVQLNRLRRMASVSSPALQRLAEEIREQLRVRRTVEIRVSDSVTSPFVCGLLKPAIMLPEESARDLSSSEVSALLSHEIAHLRQHDLTWCIAWRWMTALCWFHPLVWKIPAAHNLACEQEADQIASAQLEDGGSYAQLLAQLALRVLALPSVETALTVNGTAQIVQRLKHLGREGIRPWNWKYSVAGFGLMGAMFLLVAGCEFSKSSVASAYKEALVVVEDEDGKPIEGATIEPTGFRVKGRHSADAYNWHSWEKTPTKVTTDREGKAHLRYPVVGIPEEQELTERLIFRVVHPEFATVVIQSFSVDGTEKPIRMKRGIPLEVSGYFGSDRQPVLELVPCVSGEEVSPEDWQKKENGIFAFHKLAPGGHLLQLMGRLPSGEIVYNEGFAFTAEKGKTCSFSLEMKTGIRLEGRIDDNVPRPVKNGRVLISVRPMEIPAYLDINTPRSLAAQYGNFRPWHSYRLIAEDGSFVFESIPPGEVDVVVLGDGFVSKNGGEAKFAGSSPQPLRIGVPQPFPLAAPVTKIEVVTEPTATFDLTTKTRSGKPVEGATVVLSPNVLRMNGIFGEMEHSSEEPFRKLNPLPRGRALYSGVTDASGEVVIPNLPASERGFEIAHPHFEAPLQDPTGWRSRSVHVTFSPGATNKMELILEPKGTEFIRE
ncbi:MAG TPA: M56 family metallopeptidase [Verrucomicrobiae bacterium]|nr:M56 family metallopeptidase [Verrucomicrobiae bacterium]